MGQTHGKVIRRGCGVVGQEEEGRIRREQGLHKSRRSGNQVVLTIDDAIMPTIQFSFLFGGPQPVSGTVPAAPLQRRLTVSAYSPSSRMPAIIMEVRRMALMAAMHRFSRAPQFC